MCYVQRKRLFKEKVYDQSELTLLTVLLFPKEMIITVTQ